MIGAGFHQGDAAGSSGGELMEVVRRDDSLVPVTIHQIITAEVNDNHLVIDGVVRRNFVVVGQVISSVDTLSNFEYLITDGTGVLTVNELTIVPDAKAHPNGTYIIAEGRITVSDPSKRDMTAFQVRPITDINWVAAIHLEALMVHLRIVNGLPPGSKFAQQISSSVPRQQTTQSFQQDKPRGEDTLSDKIKTMLQGANSNGVAISDIIRRFSDEGYAVEVIRKVLDDFDSDGITYQIDREHIGPCF